MVLCQRCGAVGYTFGDDVKSLQFALFSGLITRFGLIQINVIPLNGGGEFTCL